MCPNLDPKAPVKDKWLAQPHIDYCELGVCYIYRLRYYRNCCFNNVQFDNIEYFAKTKQNAYREHTYISLRGDEAG